MAIANAQRAYGRYRERFADERWRALSAAGARPQRPLWASTGTKDPAYSDVLYVEELIAPGVVNTMPEATLRAFADHGRHCPRAQRKQQRRGRGGPSRGPGGRASTSHAITAQLERDGVRSFCASYEQLIDRIAAKTDGTVMTTEHPGSVT